ncbi:MAG: hypothetical protein K6C12_02130, partial [Oscillospiraceae bacterium]|nr:hypothetical protein [Oscillospiraceae bacterium]
MEKDLAEIQKRWDAGIEAAQRSYDAEQTVASSLNADSAAEAIDAAEQAGAQYSRFVEDEDTLRFLDEQEKAGKVVHTFKSFLEIDGKLYPPMASMQKDENGKWKMAHAMEKGRWEESIGDPSKVIVDPKTGKGYFKLKKDNGKDMRAAYNPYQHSSNLMLNDQFSSAYQRPNIVTYECIIPESELTSGYRAEYAKDAVGLHPWKAGIVATQIAKAKGLNRQVYLSRWLKPIRKVPEAEVAQHYKELLDGTDIAVPSNVVPPALLEALEDAGVKIEYTEEAPKKAATKGDVKFQRFDDAETVSIKQQIQANAGMLNSMNPATTLQINDLPNGIQKQRQWAVNRLKSSGFKVDNRDIGVIEFNERQINTGLNYLNESGEIAAFAALPAVLKRGKIIDAHNHHKNRARDSITIAAPVVINGVRGNMAVALTKTSKTHYHTHRILMPDGSTFVFENANAEVTPAEDQPERTNVSRPSLRRSDSSIADTTPERKAKMQTIDADG